MSSLISARCGFKGPELAGGDHGSSVEGHSLFQDYYSGISLEECGSYSDMAAILVHYHQDADDDDDSLTLPQYSPSRAALPYKIRGLVGYGGQGAVYRVSRGRREFVAKLARKAVWSAATMNEFIIMKDLRHPNIVQVLGALRAGFVMEPAQTNLRRLLTAGKLRPAQKTRIAAGVMEGLSYLHTGGIAHLDVKPSNILIADHCTPKLADFGLSARFVLSTGASGLLYRFVGTAPYMAPELLQFRLGGPRGVAMPPLDVWAAGCLIYQLVTGGLPFGDGDLGAIRQRQEGVGVSELGVLPEMGAYPVKNRKALLLFSAAQHMLHPNPAARPTTLYIARTYFGCVMSENVKRKSRKT